MKGTKRVSADLLAAAIRRGAQVLLDEQKVQARLLRKLLGIKTGGPQKKVAAKPKPGRHTMSAKERAEVSARMKRYWKAKRAESRAISAGR